MKRISLYPVLLVALIVQAVTHNSCKPLDKEIYFEEGVSKLLAIYRHATIKDVSYKLELSIPASKDEPVNGKESIEFALSAKTEPLVIDFRVPDEYLESVVANGKTVDTVLYNGHIIIPEKLLRRGYNKIDIRFRAGDLSLNRNDDFLYTLFVPDRASTTFPCLDQPDLKALFSLTLEVPLEYEAISNSPVTDITISNRRKTYRFAVTKPLSTYLFAFAAGKFERIEKEVNGIKMEMLHRETRSEYISNNADEIFRLHYNSIRWLEDYTGIEYPFDKFGFVLIPSFQYSGMEHPGSICYRSSALLLEENPTLNEQLSRSSLIAHETSHIWFGDLVTMKWFDDVWLKEVFAGFISDKIVNPDFPDVNHDLRFLLSRYPAAYSVDRTGGSNPVIQKLDNLKNAGSLYGKIIYNKAPVVMKHLEMITGSEGLRKGLRKYLSQYAFGNAKWDDLISILEDETSLELESWSTVWVKEAGMPFISAVTEKTPAGYCVSFSETDPGNSMRHWPQQLEAIVITSRDTAIGTCTPGDSQNCIDISAPHLCIIPDKKATAYGTFILDSTTLSWISVNIDAINNPLVRGVSWINLYENLVNRRISPEDFYNTLSHSLGQETDIQLQNYLISRMSSVYWDYMTPDQRAERSSGLEAMTWEKMSNVTDPAVKRLWYSLFRNIALTGWSTGKLRKIWSGGELPGGIKLSEDELCTLAFALALKDSIGNGEILIKQKERITNPDRLKRFEFIIPSLSKDAEIRDSFFESLHDPANREHEPWVLEALGYLHHPLVSEKSVPYILPSLEMLEEIKATGDIFFPGDWISTTLAGHHSDNAGEIVREFLDDHPDYPADLRLKILQAADHLLRYK